MKKTDVQFLVEILSITEDEAIKMMKNDTQKAIDILFENKEWYEQEHQEILSAFGNRIERVNKTPLENIETISYDEMKILQGWK